MGDKKVKKYHWLSWDHLCQSKVTGGLGFHNLEAFNLALLAKQGWCLLQNNGSLFSAGFKDKYYPNDDFLSSALGFSMFGVVFVKLNL